MGNTICKIGGRGFDNVNTKFAQTPLLTASLPLIVEKSEPNKAQLSPACRPLCFLITPEMLVSVGI